MKLSSNSRLTLNLIVITLGRWCLNTSIRMVYPFLPAFARGLDISLQQAAQLVSFRNIAGILGPLFAPLSERFGRQKVLIGSLLLFAVSCLSLLLFPTVWGLGATLFFIIIAKILYDPALQAYVGDTVPYAQRGKAIALTEFSWSGALLVGAPIVGWLMIKGGWLAPFGVLGVAGLVSAGIIWLVMPKTLKLTSTATSWRGVGRVIKKHPLILAVCAYVGLATLANDLVFIVYGDWMERSFGLDLGRLGLASGVIGCAEILGELSAGWGADRFGKRVIVILSGSFLIIAYLLLPQLGQTFVPALILLGLTFFFFETMIVGGIPLLTELVPSARAVVMTLALAAGAAGRALGAGVGPLLWQWGGLTVNGWVSAGISIIVVLIVILWLKESSYEKKND